MFRTIKKALHSNIMLKVAAGIMGYTVWAVISQSHVQDHWHTIPVCIHSLPDTIHVDAPETIDVRIAGRKSDMYTLDSHNLALHIDGQSLHAGENLIAITNATLFLPETIKLLHYTPHQVRVILSQTVAQAEQPTIVT